MLTFALPVPSGERTALPKKFSLSEVCARSLDTREWQKKSQQHWMGSTDPTLSILLPSAFTEVLDFHFWHRTGSLHAICLLDFHFWQRVAFSLLYRVFCHFVVLCCCVLRSTNLIDKNGTFKRPFSASNFDSQCRLLRHPLCLFNVQVLSLFHMAFYHHWTLRGCDLNCANLIAKNGSWNLPFLPSNCVIRCVTWLHSRFASGLNLVSMGFYQQLYHLSVDCGGSIPPSEFWSWISSTLTLDGFHCPWRSSNCMSECNLSLFTCHGVDLPSELLYLFARKFSAISCMALSWFVFSTCIFPMDTCLSATSVHKSDDSRHESPLPLLNTCTHSTFSIGASLPMSTCILSIDTCLVAICERGLDDSSHVSPLHLHTACIHSTFSTVACHLFDTCCVLTFATCFGCTLCTWIRRLYP